MGAQEIKNLTEELLVFYASQEGSKPSKPRPANHADKWVSGQTPAPKEVVRPAKAKRLTLDLDEDLHRRIKVACSLRGTTMVEEITKLLKKNFPES